MGKRKGQKFQLDEFDTVIDTDTDCFDIETGKVLFKFRKNVFPKEALNDARESLLKLGKTKNNQRAGASSTGGYSSGSICGYFDKPKLRYGDKRAGAVCRKTAFNRDHADKFEKAIPLLTLTNKWYKELMPEEYLAQLNRAEMTRYRIRDTVFSTITVNHNFRTSLHKDKGDFKEGFGNLVIIEEGEYSGGQTGFPRFGVCVDCRTGDYLAMQVHEWHCNTEIVGEDYSRLALVCYLREKIKDCVGHHVYSVKADEGLGTVLTELSEKVVPQDYIYIFYPDKATLKQKKASVFYNHVVSEEGNHTKEFSEKYLRDAGFDKIDYLW